MNNNTMAEELNKLRDFLINKKYKCWDTEYNDYPNVNMITQKLQRRLDIDFPNLPVCDCNDKLSINVDICQAVVHGNLSVTAEIHLCHANKQNEWCNLKIYSLKPEDIYNNLEYYEDKLMKMWELFYV